MLISSGFWSYVHDDDEAERGRISLLVDDIVNQYQMMTGEKITLYIDKQLEWGEKWREIIDQKISSSVFFIPVITPRYIASPACRGELEYFVKNATDLGLRDLILPILYVDFDEFHNQDTSDSLIKLLNGFQWEDWTEIRFFDVNSEGYRRNIVRLSKRLFEANKNVDENNKAAEIVLPLQPSVTENEPGFIDLLAEAEESIPKCATVLEEFTQEMKKMTALTSASTEEINGPSGRSFSARLMITKRLAVKLTEPIDKMWELSTTYSALLNASDSGVRLLINKSVEEVEKDAANKEVFCSFFKSLSDFDTASNEASKKFEELINASETIEDLSRDIRPKMQKLQKSLFLMISTGKISNGWIQKINETGLVC